MDQAHLAAVIEAFRKAQLDLSIDEWRDTVYLARHLGAAGWEPEAQGGATTDASPPTAQAALPDPAAAVQPPADIPRTADGQAGPSLLIRPYPPAGSAEDGGVPVRAPAAPALVSTAFAKAFRPLRRTVDSSVDVELDVLDTVHKIADSGIWHPVLVPATDRWLSLAVVIDDAASGPAWAHEIAAVLRAMQESGAFGDIRVWRFDSDSRPDVPVTIRGDAATAVAGRNSREIIDPNGRRAVLVFSDCVGAGWGDGRVGNMIEQWTVSSPVAIVHLLPQRLWGRCRPRLVGVEWRCGRQLEPGQPLQWRKVTDGEFIEPEASSSGLVTVGVMVPVLDLTPSALNGWARLVAGDARDWLPGVAFHTAGVASISADLADDEPVSDDPNRDRVARFRASCSPQAFRLATLLAAAPLQPPVVRMIQRTMGVERSTYWAEVVLSGLVEWLPPAVGGDDQPVYDFVKGVREELLTGLTRQESLRLLHEVSEFISSRLGGTLDFLALLTSDTPVLTDADRPFARVAAQVLSSLGGAYADKADKIRRHLSNGAPPGVRSEPIPIAHPAAEIGTLSRDGDLVTASNVTDARSQDISRTVIWDVPQRTANFIGRQELLDELREGLVGNPNRAAVLVPRAIFGLGGVGKTALANEYAHRFRDDYEVVWWIPAEDPADIRRSLVDLSGKLRLPENTDQSETIRALLRELQDGYPNRRWLLIFDNATDPDKVREYLPKPKPYGHVLITSREPAWSAEGRAVLEVDVFTRAESTTLLQRRADYLSEEDADGLAELLNDLPLALHQAAAWHAETHQPASDYRRRYDEKLALLAEVDLPREYPRAVGAAFGVSYDQLQSNSAAAAQLLQLCSYFGPEPIFVEMLYRARNVPGLPSALRRQMADRSTIARELREISRYELIRFDQARGRFQLHRLVQSVLRSTLPEEQRQTTSLHAHSVLALANPGNPDELDAYGLIRHAQLSPHILPSRIVESTDDEARKVVLDQIRYRYVVGDYEGSRDLAESTVKQWLEQHGDRDVLVLLARRHLAQTLRSLGDPSESLRIDEEVLALFRETVGENDDHYLVTANGYAADLRALGRFGQALRFDRELLAQHRRVLRDDDPATLRTANNYAVDLRLMGEFRLARELDTETVRLWTEGYGSDHPETLFAVSNLVRDYYGLGRYGEALTRQQEAITVQEIAVGATHPSVLLARRTIAMLLRKLGRYQQAREWAEANYAAYTARFPEHHEHTLAATMSLANALRDERKDLESLQRARQLMEGALRQYERSFEGHPFVEVCMSNLAVILRRLGEVARARDLNQKARRGLREKLGDRHPYTLCTTTNLANDFAAMRDYTSARELSGLTLELSREAAVRGDDHPYTLGCALNHALDLEGSGSEREADALWQDTVARFNRVLGPDHPDSLAAGARQRIDADIEPPPT